LHDTLREKAAIIAINDEEEISFMGGEWRDGRLSGSLSSFGRFSVTLDTLPPVINPLNAVSGEDMSRENAIRFGVEDDLSGIRSYDGYIDNKWALFEYNARDGQVCYYFDKERLKKGTRHELELYIIDNRDNLAYYYTEFYW